MIIRARVRRLVMERGLAMDQADVRRALTTELTGLFGSGVVSPSVVEQRLSRGLTMESQRRRRR